MKKLMPNAKGNNLIPLSLIVLLFLFYACKPTEEPMPNQKPGAFTVEVETNLTEATISWSESVDPDEDLVRYDLVVEEDTLLNATTQREYTLTDLDFNTSYNGTVIARDEEGLFQSQNFQFTTGDSPNSPPSTFILTAPNTGANYLDLTLTLFWDEASDPDGDPVTYDVLLDQGANPTTVIGSDLTNTGLVVEDFEEETTYYWKVVAKDGRGGETSSETRYFTTRASVVATLETTAPWAKRTGHAVLEYNGKLWVIGGDTGSGGRFNDVWSSTDGTTWVEETSAAQWPARTVHTATVFDGKMWIYGGNSAYTAGSEFGDLWYSTDGINWTEQTINASIPARYGHNMLSFNGKMWIFGGRDVDLTYSRDQIWNSSDGANWTLVTEDIGFSHSSLGEFEVREDTLWYIGGYNDNVRWSIDGINWTQVTNMAPFGDRIGHACTVHDGLLWLISGSDNKINQLQELPDVWYSQNGVDWILAAQNADFDPVNDAEAISFNGKLWLIGGGGGFQSFFVTNKVYSFE